MEISYFKLLKERNITVLWLAGLISIAGDWLLTISLPFAVYNLTGSTLATGLLFLVQTIPDIFFGQIAGVVADRLNRKTIMIVSDFSRAILLLLLLMVNSAEGVWIIFIVAFLQSFTSQFFYTAQQGIVPQIASSDKLVKVNALFSLSNSIIGIIGPIIGGIIYSIVGLHALAVLDATSFFISGILLLFLTISNKGEKSIENENFPTENFWNQLVDGLIVVKGHLVIVTLFIVMGIVMFVQGIISVMIVPFASEVIGGGATTFSYLASTQGAGMLIGGLMIGVIGEKFSLTSIIALTGILSGIIFLVEVNFPYLPLVLLCSFLFGIPMVMFNVFITSLLQNSISDRYRGRVFGTYQTLNSLFMLCGLGLATLGGDFIPTITFMNIAAILYVVAGIYAYLRLPKEIKLQDKEISV